MRLKRSLVPVLLLSALAFAHPALAGPPLLCHPFDIGDARSLPWNGATAWFEGRPDYQISTVVDDTMALLTPSTPVIVRMETLRRSVIYASANAQVAATLLQRLVARANATEAAGRPDALAFLDAAYAAGALREIGLLRESAPFRDRAAAIAQVAKAADDYALITKALAARPDDPAIHFAAALIASDSHRSAFEAHKAKAAAGTAADALLARNVSHVF
ncbi:MAG: hypothetical protein ABJC89_01655 [Acidobacteriota bacterium]